MTYGYVPIPKHPQNMNSAELGNTNLQKHTQPELTNLPAGSNPYDHQQHSLYQTTDLWMQLETYKKPGASLVKDPLPSHAKITHADEQTNFLPPLCQQSTTSISPRKCQEYSLSPLMVKRWPSHVYCEAAIITRDNRKGAHREAVKSVLLAYPM